MGKSVNRKKRSVMAEWKELKCENCGGQKCKSLSSTEQQCVYCGTIFAQDGDAQGTIEEILRQLPRDLSQKILLLMDMKMKQLPTPIQRLVARIE